MTQDKGAVVQVRLSTKDRKRIEAVASRAGVAVSQFVRRLVRMELGMEEDE